MGHPSIATLLWLRQLSPLVFSFTAAGLGAYTIPSCLVPFSTISIFIYCSRLAALRSGGELEEHEEQDGKNELERLEIDWGGTLENLEVLVSSGCRGC
jgi:hypothetical protein